MALTLTEKILAKHAGKNVVSPGEIVEVEVDKVFVHDIFAAAVIHEFTKQNKKVWDPEKIVFIVDHELPSVSQNAGAKYQEMAQFAKEQSIDNFYYGEGICHQIMPEQGHVKPGDIIIGTDSHTVTYGALNAFSTGIGSKEMSNIWATGKIWLKVPKTIKFILDGELQKGVYSKDLILYILGMMKADGCVYNAIEFAGDTINSLSMDARFTMTNMVVEMGAKNGIMPFDTATKTFLDERNIMGYQIVENDPDADYSQVHHVDVSTIHPQMATDKSIDDVIDVHSKEGMPIHQGFIGSCTNGRIEDLRIAAAILNGKKVAPYIKFIVTPASRSIFKQAMGEGLINTFLDAGAVVTGSGCGLCYGAHGGVVGENEVAICANNRNFPGRLGHKNAKIFLASPATVAASVIEGKITSPEKYFS
ncbi:MAG: 3-isopropylmalate dehydratase large subunit [Deltaproteobacteria bacterium]|nr:3-isopropylmalate dehydratase large subunit [Deltaproteobacteria bacterium]